MGANRVTVAILAGAAITCFAGACGTNNPPSGGSPPFSALPISGDSLHKLATNASLWPVRQSAERTCEGSVLCWLPFGRRVEVNIYADTGARNLDPNPRGSGAKLVGRFENTGESTERRYNLTNGQYDFLLFVFPASAGTEGRWVVEQVSKAPVGNTYAHETVSQGVYRGCGHPTTTYSKSFGAFRTCEMGPPVPPPGVDSRTSGITPRGVHTAGFSAFSLSALYMLFSVSGDPAWYTCRSGCCTADPM